MKYVISDMAEAQAVGICWLARQPGLPDIAPLRIATATLHERPCGWCDYPVGELLGMLERRNVSDFAERAWWGLPSKARSRAIAHAQSREDAA